MATGSRNYILTRRGAGISDLSNVTLQAGEMDMDQADHAGVYKVNCTHQVGIATSTEVGLTADRYPIRVILTSSPDTLIPEVNQTVCSYWKVVNAAGAPVVYSRKPLQTDLSIKNLYSVVQDLDNKLWDAADLLKTTQIVDAIDPAINKVVEDLYTTTQVLSPTAEQYALITNMVDEIILKCLSTSRYPYFKVAQNVYLRGEPHGKHFEPLGAISAARCALYETVLCMKVNYDRLRAKHEAISDGAVTLASYSIANMFRLGLFESYEHREYFTVIATPVPGADKQFQIHSVKTPAGTVAPADLAVGTKYDISSVRLMKQLIEIGNSMVMGSGLMHYLFNHTTGGNVITGTLLTTLSMYQFLTGDMPIDTQIAITSAYYEALHPTNKRAIANIFFKKSGVTTHGRCATAPRMEKFQLDAFMSLRCNPYPAGSHKAFICLQALSRVLQAGLAPFLPWADQMATCINLCREVLNSGARAHIGSSYYTGEPPRAQPASLDLYLPELAMYVHTFNKGDSLSMSPHMSLEISKKSAMNWQNLMKELKAKDISATSAEKVREFLATSGSVHFTFDPNDQGTWGKTVEESKKAQAAINEIFN